MSREGQQERRQEQEQEQGRKQEQGRRRLTWFGLAAAGVLLLAGFLTLIAGEAVRERLVRPLLIFLQVLKIYFDALPQLVVWFLVLLLLLLLGGYLLRDLERTARARRGHPGVAEDEGGERGHPLRRGTVREVAERLRLACEGEYFRWRVHRELLDFLVRLLAWRWKLPPEEALALVRSREWTDNPKVREFFAHGLTRRAWRWRLPWLRRTDAAFFRELAQVLDYLEHYVQGGEGGSPRSQREVPRDHR